MILLETPAQVNSRNAASPLATATACCHCAYHEDVTERRLGRPVTFEDVDTDIATRADIWVKDLSGRPQGPKVRVSTCDNEAYTADFRIAGGDPSLYYPCTFVRKKPFGGELG